MGRPMGGHDTPHIDLGPHSDLVLHSTLTYWRRTYIILYEEVDGPADGRDGEVEHNTVFIDWVLHSTLRYWRRTYIVLDEEVDGSADGRDGEIGQELRHLLAAQPVPLQQPLDALPLHEYQVLPQHQPSCSAQEDPLMAPYDCQNGLLSPARSQINLIMKH
jgi:hypothetical protein